MMRKLPTVVAVACVFSLAGTLRAADSPTGAQTQPGVIEGAQTDTAASAGQWRFFCNAHDATVKAANADAIWFSAGGNLWRYNIRTRSIDATTSPLTHPNLDGPSLHLALADDGRMIASVRNATYLWVPKSGWARLPQPAGMENSGFPAFDKASTPWFVASGFSDGSMVCPWDNGVWGEWIKVNKQIHGLCPLGDGWLTWTYPDSSAKSTAFTWFDAKFQTRRELANDVPPSSFTGQCYHAGGKVLGLFLATPQGGSRDDQVGGGGPSPAIKE